MATKNIPNIDTTTGCAFRTSASGKVIDTVNTEPKLVPTHNVGSNVVGSVRTSRLELVSNSVYRTHQYSVQNCKFYTMYNTYHSFSCNYLRMLDTSQTPTIYSLD